MPGNPGEGRRRVPVPWALCAFVLLLLARALVLAYANEGNSRDLHASLWLRDTDREPER